MCIFSNPFCYRTRRYSRATNCLRTRTVDAGGRDSCACNRRCCGCCGCDDFR